MNPGGIRRGLHSGYALTSLLLIASGLLLWDADLRTRIVGGYGREILDFHLWVGWLFVALPLLVLATARPLLRDLRRRLGPPDPPLAWPKVHIVGSLLAVSVLSATGVVLWADPELPLAWVDAMSALHLATSGLLTLSIPVHLVLARRKIASRSREILGRASADGPPSPFDFNESGD